MHRSSWHYQLVIIAHSIGLSGGANLDTYDGMTMIDATQLQACAQECLCRTFRCPCGSNPSPLAFIVSLDVGQTKIFIRSDELFTALLDLGVTFSGREVTESELLRKANLVQRGSKVSLKRKSATDGFYTMANLLQDPFFVSHHDDNNVISCGLRLLDNYLSISCGTRYDIGPCTSSFDTSPLDPVCQVSENLRVDQVLNAPGDPCSSRLLPPNNASCICSERPEEELICPIEFRSSVGLCSLLHSMESALSHRIFNLDAVGSSGRTVLIAAIEIGNREIITRLISAGADVNAMAPCGTPLSIATKIGSKDIIKLLLEQGADPELTKILLKSHGISSHQRQFQIWAGVLDQCKEKARRSKTAQIRYNFREEYRKIARAAHQVSPDRYGGWKTRLERDALLDWKRDVDSCAERGWRTGLRMLRKLCNRNVPRNVNEVIMGIALARAMAVILGKEIDESILYDLNEDLSRWQILFSREARFAFSDAVRRIWSVSLFGPLKEGSTVAEEIFEDFQVMAEKLMEKARDVFGLVEPGDTSGSEWGPDDGSSRDTDRIRHHQDSRSSEHLRDEQQDLFDGGPDRTTLMWLMAGVFFACLIAVLLGTLMISKLPDGKSDPRVVLHATQINTGVLGKCYGSIKRSAFFVSVGHFLEHEQQLPDIRNGFIGNEVRESISHGTIMSVDALERFISSWCHTWEMGEPERKRLSRKCDDLRNRIQMQIAQGAIELYLHYTSSDTVQSSSNENSSEAEQAREATSFADTEMTSFQFSSSSRPSEEQHTPGLAQEILLQSDLDNSDAAPRVNPSHRTSGRKLYACDICNHLFNRSNLKKHKQDMHNPKGKKTHKCTVCGRGFGRDDNRRHHEEKKHGVRFEDRRKQKRRSD